MPYPSHPWLDLPNNIRRSVQVLAESNNITEQAATDIYQYLAIGLIHLEKEFS
jgi:hypothetical protein